MRFLLTEAHYSPFSAHDFVVIASSSIYFIYKGEVACTGLHGANRLASTSLLEGLVWGCSIADHLVDTAMRGSCKADLAASADLYSLLPPNIPGDGAPSAPSTILDSVWKDIRCA